MKLTGLLHSDDVAVMLTALSALVGTAYEWDRDDLVITGGAGRLQQPLHDIYLGNAGTASRFLTSVCVLGSGRTVLTGTFGLIQETLV